MSSAGSAKGSVVPAPVPAALTSTGSRGDNGNVVSVHPYVGSRPEFQTGSRARAESPAWNSGGGRVKRAGLEDAVRCSFCHRSPDEVGKLISSPSDYPRAYICDECVVAYKSILKKEEDREGNPAMNSGGVA